MFKKLLLIIPVLILSLFLLSKTTFALEDDSVMEKLPKTSNAQKEFVNEKKMLGDRVGEVRENVKEVRDELKENREENVAKRCELSSSRLENHVANATENKTKYSAFYNNAKEKVTEFVNKLSEEGYDTSKLIAELKVMEGLVADLETAYDNYIIKLKDTANYECGNSDGKYVASLQEVRSAFLDVRKAAVAIREEYSENIRPLIKELRAEKKSAVESEKETQ